jgi:hypothetical protein
LTPYPYPCRIIVALLLTAMVMTACSTTSYLKVTYQSPAETQDAVGQSVYLSVTDGTGGTPFVGTSAAKELKQFSGLFSVYLAESQQKPRLEGAFDAVGLFETAFKKRLEASGVAVTGTATQGTPTLRVNVTDFQIDKAGRTWKARLAYKAAMRKGGKELTTQTVSGTAERAKIVGISDAEKLLGEIVSDSVNKLDIETLFDHSEL